MFSREQLMAGGGGRVGTVVGKKIGKKGLRFKSRNRGILLNIKILLIPGFCSRHNPAHTRILFTPQSCSHQDPVHTSIFFTNLVNILHVLNFKCIMHLDKHAIIFCCQNIQKIAQIQTTNKCFLHKSHSKML